MNARYGRVLLGLAARHFGLVENLASFCNLGDVARARCLCTDLSSASVVA